MSFIKKHLDNVRQSLIAKSNEISSFDHKGSIGTARELVVNEFLAKNLPKGFDFLSGEIVDTNETKSNQIDILILPHSAPRFILSGDLAIGLLHAVSAIMEVKSDLTKDQLLICLESTKTVKSLEFNPVLDPWPWSATKNDNQIRLNHIPSMIFGYKGMTIDTLNGHIGDWLAVDGNNESHLPDIITCLERNYTLTRNNDWHYSKTGEDMYIVSKGECLIDLFSYLMKSLQAWDYAKPRTPLSEY